MIYTYIMRSMVVMFSCNRRVSIHLSIVYEQGHHQQHHSFHSPSSITPSPLGTFDMVQSSSQHCDVNELHCNGIWHMWCTWYSYSHTVYIYGQNIHLENGVHKSFSTNCQRFPELHCIPALLVLLLCCIYIAVINVSDFLCCPRF